MSLYSIYPRGIVLPPITYQLYFGLLVILFLINGGFVLRLYLSNRSQDNLFLLLFTIFIYFFSIGTFLFNRDLGISIPNDIIWYELSIIGLNLAKIFFVLYAFSPILSKFTRAIGHLSNYISIGIIFVVVTGLIYPEFDTFISSEGQYSTLPENWISFAMASVLALYVIFQVLQTQVSLKKYMQTKTSSMISIHNYKLVSTFYFALLVGSSGFILIEILAEPPYSEFIESIYMFSLLLMIAAFSLLNYYIAKSPTFVLLNFNDISELMEAGVLGWFLVSNKDVGPEIEAKSPSFFQYNDVGEGQIFKFAINSLMFATVTEEFQSNVFVTPFYGEDEYLSFNVTFGIKDPTVTDERLKGIAYSVFTTLVPIYLVPILNIKTGMFNRMEKILGAATEEFQEMKEFKVIDNLEEIAIEIFRELFN